jgi:hypothetical protein
MQENTKLRKPSPPRRIRAPADRSSQEQVGSSHEGQATSHHKLCVFTGFPLTLPRRAQ